MTTDSDSDHDEKDDIKSLHSIIGLDVSVRESSANSTTGSVSGTSCTMAGPIIPPQIQQGTVLRKISRKNRSKRIRLAYDSHTNKMTWGEGRPSKFFHVDEIKEIRTGSDIQQYGKDFNIPEIERINWFTIIYYVPEKSKPKFMHLVADDFETFQFWTLFLQATLQHRQEMMMSLMSFNDQAIAHYWQSEMDKQYGALTRARGDDEMDISSVKRVCQNLHIYSSQSTLETIFRLCDPRGRERLDFPEFMEFVRRMKQRQEVSHIIRGIAVRPDLGLTLDEFLAFLRQTQGEDTDTDRATWGRVFNRFSCQYGGTGPELLEISSESCRYMSEAALLGYLSSPQNVHLLVEPQDYILDRPLNEYFISSSHNTYLLGRQVAGESSVEGYINALTGGCRCVEIDCWDGPDGQPQVLHGRTLTKAISFKEVVAVINKYGFSGHTRAPIWISLEVHCNPAQQAIMADMIKEAFGSRLILAPLDSASDKFPLVSELMGRVIIKVKVPAAREEPPSTEVSGRKRGNSFSGTPLTNAVVPENGAFTPSQSVPPSPMLSPSPSTRRFVNRSRVDTITEGQTQTLLGASSDNESGSEAGTPPNQTSKIVKVLGDLGVYCAGIKFAGLDSPDAKKFNHIFSFKESSFTRHTRSKEEKMALDIHNMRYLMRVYPDGTRVSSSNFDPLTYWRRGVQMAAMNCQTFDLGMQLNRAMFEGGKDSSGYVLKPPELRDIQVLPYNYDLATGKKERSVVSFSIDVISAQQLMRPANLSSNRSMDPYIEVEVFHANDKRDKKADSSSTGQQDSALKFQTEVIRENGFNPVFNEGRFKFRVTTKHPELVFVRWSVKLSNDGGNYSNNRPPIASYMAKLKNLKPGYRHLPLHNHMGDQYLFSTLFCKIQVDPITKTLIDAPDPVSEPSAFNRLGSKVFGRTNSSPRSTFERSSTERPVIDGYQ